MPTPAGHVPGRRPGRGRPRRAPSMTALERPSTSTPRWEPSRSTGEARAARPARLPALGPRRGAGHGHARGAGRHPRRGGARCSPASATPKASTTSTTSRTPPSTCSTCWTVWTWPRSTWSACRSADGWRPSWPCGGPSGCGGMVLVNPVGLYRRRRAHHRDLRARPSTSSPPSFSPIPTHPMAQLMRAMDGMRHRSGRRSPSSSSGPSSSPRRPRPSWGGTPICTTRSCAAAWRRITAPTLVVHARTGRHRAARPRRGLRRRPSPTPRLVDLEGAAHLAALERPVSARCARQRPSGGLTRTARIPHRTGRATSPRRRQAGTVSCHGRRRSWQERRSVAARRPPPTGSGGLGDARRARSSDTGADGRRPPGPATPATPARTPGSAVLRWAVVTVAIWCSYWRGGIGVRIPWYRWGQIKTGHVRRA